MQKFFNALFDFSFSEFITTKIIKVIYGLGILVAAVLALLIIINGFGNGFLVGILAIIVSPIIFIVYTILVRVWLEVVIVLFRISENVIEIAKSNKK